MTQTWLIYAKSGREFQVADDIALFASVWCGRILEGKPDPKRRGRKSITLWTERPALPNYLFATLTPDEYQIVKTMRDVVGFVSVVNPAAQRGIQQFIRATENAYTAAQRARDRGDRAPPLFHPGQVLEAVGGPPSGLMARYRQVIEDADGYHIEAETDLGRVRFNPADVRAAG